MSSTAKIQLGDPSHGGALFLLPREIRDEIYRLLVRGRYLADNPEDDCGYSNSDEIDYTGIDDGPAFSILRVSKVLCHEAKIILYSESVFRFVIDRLHQRDNEKVHGKLYRLKKFAPMMMNVVLDVHGESIANVEWCNFRPGCTYHVGRFERSHVGKYERSLAPTIDLFGDPDIKRHSLHLRLLECSTTLTFWSTTFGERSNHTRSLFISICQRLKKLVSFRVPNVEVMLTRDLLVAPRFHGFVYTEQSRCARELVCHITQTISEQLETAFGPATFEIKSSARDIPLSKENLLRLDEVGLVGFLNFHPGKHSVKESVAGRIQGSEE